MSNVPKLRFKEFSEEWEDKKLVQVVDFKSGYAFPSSDMSNEPQKYQLIKMSNVYQNVLALDRSPSYWKDINKSQSEFLLEEGDTLLTLTGTVGKRDYGYSVMIKENNKFLLNQRLVRLRAKEGSSNSRFIRNLVLNERFLYYFFINSKGGTGNQSNVSIEDLKQIKIPLPSQQEQEKIASFLTSVDTKVEQLTKKEELLKQYKKGVMQKIFSQQIRFKADDGSEFEDWEQKKLGDVFSGIKGQGLSKGDIIEDGINKCILYGELYTTYPEVIKDIASNTNSSSSVKSLKGDLLVPCSTTTTGIDLADVTALYEDDVLLGGDITILRFKKSGNPTFFAYYLTHHKKHDLAKYGQGSTIVHMYYSHFKTMLIKFPSSIVEQTKIADFLSSIDSKIEQVQKQLESTKQFKKALLQQMFV